MKMQKKYFINAIFIVVMIAFLLGCSGAQEDTVFSYERIEVPLVYGGSAGFITYLDWVLYPDDDKVLADLSGEQEGWLEHSVAPDSVDEDTEKISYTEKVEYAKECLEKYLPDTGLVSAWLPSDMVLKDYCTGDIGNDGVNDIAVIVGSHIFVLSEEADGYRLTDDNEHIVDWKEQLEIKDGKLTCRGNDFTMDSFTIYYEFEYKDSALILSYMEEKYYYGQSGQGLRVEYHLDKGVAEAYAYTEHEGSFEPWLVYTGELFKRDGEVPTYTFDKTGYLTPKIVESTVVYSPSGDQYDYHNLPIEELVAEGGWEPWQIAYMEVMDYYTTEYEEWYDERIYFNLIYLDDDDVPELVLDLQHLTMAVFTYAPGKECDGIKDISAVLDFGPYGMVGIMGYDYYPRENILFYYDKDMAGAQQHIYYCRINEEKELEKIYSVTQQYIEVEGVMEDIYYYNDKEVSESVYISHIMEDDYSSIAGYYLAGEMVVEMRKYE